MYAGCWNFKTLKVSVAILNSIREETGSQWSLWSTGEIWLNWIELFILQQQHKKKLYIDSANKMQKEISKVHNKLW